MAYQDIDFTYFPDSVTEIHSIRDRLRSVLDNFEAESNSNLRKDDYEAYKKHRQETNGPKSDIYSYIKHLLRCETFLFNFPFVYTNIRHDPKTIPFFNRKLEYMTTHEVLWKFVNPNDAPLTYEQHNAKSLCESVTGPIDTVRLGTIDLDWKRGEPYIVEWLNDQIQTEYVEFPQYIFIKVLVYVFQLPREEEEYIPEEEQDEVACESENEQEVKIIYEIDEETFELQLPSSSSSDITSTEIIFKTDIRTRLPTQLLSLIFCYLDYTDYYHDREALCSIMGFPQDEFMRLWWSCSHHDTLTKVDDTGTYMDTYYYINGQLHRENDEPAMIMSDGSVEYRICGERHREGDKPARVSAKGSELYYIKGALHRDFDKPAVIRKRSDKIWKCEWYQNGFCHRDGDKPAFIENDGTQKWYRRGQSHREGDKPAIITPEYDHYKKHDFSHRGNGKPAFIKHDGSLTEYMEYGWYHRIQGPAFIEPTRHMYYQQGKQHRLDGPAAIDLHDSTNNEMYIHGNPDMGS